MPEERVIRVNTQIVDRDRMIEDFKKQMVKCLSVKKVYAGNFLPHGSFYRAFSSSEVPSVVQSKGVGK